MVLLLDVIQPLVGIKLLWQLKILDIAREGGRGSLRFCISNYRIGAHFHSFLSGRLDIYKLLAVRDAGTKKAAVLLDFV